MPLSASKRILLFSLVAIFLCFNAVQAEGVFPFKGLVNANSINIRSDSRVSAEIICTVNKNECLEIVSEFFDWYKVRLPPTAPSFVRKDLVTIINRNDIKPADNINVNINPSQAASVSKDSVNVRLYPNQSSVILGKVSRNEIVTVLEEKGQWYRIEPPRSAHGWIYKKFVHKGCDPCGVVAPAERINDVKDKSVAVQGKVEPYGRILGRIATHRLITQNKEKFLLKGNKSVLNTLTYKMVRIDGRVIAFDEREKCPVIEIDKIEALK